MLEIAIIFPTIKIYFALTFTEKLSSSFHKFWFLLTTRRNKCKPVHINDSMHTIYGLWKRFE